MDETEFNDRYKISKKHANNLVKFAFQMSSHKQLKTSKLSECFSFSLFSIYDGCYIQFAKLKRKAILGYVPHHFT